MNLQHLGCWNHLQKLAEMLRNTFHRENISLILEIIKLLRKNKSKKLNSWSFSQPFMLRAQIWYIELPVKANINIAHTVNVFKSERV